VFASIPLPRHYFSFTSTTVAIFALLIVPALCFGQALDKANKIAELEKELSGLQKQLADLKAEKTGTGKKPLQMLDVVGWKTIRGTALSSNGEWFACRSGPAEGNGEVILRQTKGDKEYKFPAGGPGIGLINFSHNSKWFAFSIMPPFSPSLNREVGASQTTRPPTRMNVGLVNLATGEKTEFDGIRRFAFSGEAATCLALLKYVSEPSDPGASGENRPAVPNAPPVDHIPSVHEILADNTFRAVNVTDAQGQINIGKEVLESAAGGPGSGAQMPRVV